MTTTMRVHCDLCEEEIPLSMSKMGTLEIKTISGSGVMIHPSERLDVCEVCLQRVLDLRQK